MNDYADTGEELNAAEYDKKVREATFMYHRRLLSHPERFESIERALFKLGELE